MQKKKQQIVLMRYFNLCEFCVYCWRIKWNNQRNHDLPSVPEQRKRHHSNIWGRRLVPERSNSAGQVFLVSGMCICIFIPIPNCICTQSTLLQPKSDDPISTDICVGCWARVSDFNEFYASVEKAHRLLTERFSIKGGEQPERIATSSSSSVAGEQKQEKQEDTKDFPLHSECDAEEDLAQENDHAVEAMYASGSESDAAASFSNEQFLNDVLAQQQDADVHATDSPDMPDQAAAPEAVQERRETRSTRAKSKAQQAAETAAAEQPVSAKRRGRSKPEKINPSAEELPKNKRYADYKKSMLEIDEKIAQHMRLTCSICHEGQETFLLLCKHMMQVHHRKGYAVCCNKKFYKRSFLTDHIDRHSNPEKFKWVVKCGL